MCDYLNLALESLLFVELVFKKLRSDLEVLQIVEVRGKPALRCYDSRAQIHRPPGSW